MSRGADIDGRDEPARGADDHAELLSTLDSHDLALAMDLVDASDNDVFAVDAGADPEAAFPQSVASGGPTPRGVILWTRLAPDAFDPRWPSGCRWPPTRTSRRSSTTASSPTRRGSSPTTTP
jgi:alkaline phosphatase D